MKSKEQRRKTILKKLQHDMKKDEADPQRLAKWLKVVESKRKVFALEDEIDKLTKSLKKQ